ncbi:uncharacterized protein CLUP02_06572 [Colletotrichum lupini]|uniref:Uncharacterized protein n=1 Tax=Colletotrichum lupini TaxID=145971 RepID=A0A9Q8SQM9_9PEZI|nr:uncharacterized protein CLUP02_06572 [Colletotrichum lupini]UQC81086.1 hypothetical protein CLUP02_06572 [Colletotrichum lupini]
MSFKDKDLLVLHPAAPCGRIASRPGFLQVNFWTHIHPYEYHANLVKAKSHNSHPDISTRGSRIRLHRNNVVVSFLAIPDAKWAQKQTSQPRSKKSSVSAVSQKWNQGRACSLPDSSNQHLDLITDRTTLATGLQARRADDSRWPVHPSPKTAIAWSAGARRLTFPPAANHAVPTMHSSSRRRALHVSKRPRGSSSSFPFSHSFPPSSSMNIFPSCSLSAELDAEQTRLPQLPDKLQDFEYLICQEPLSRRIFRSTVQLARCTDLSKPTCWNLYELAAALIGGTNTYS